MRRDALHADASATDVRDEHTVCFGPGGALVGTVTLPPVAPAAVPARPGLILLNAGAVRRMGPHRINAKIARRVARLGVPSLRFDLSAHGDSVRGEAGASRRLRTTAEIGAALSELEQRAGVRGAMLFGICSGADDGLAAALHDLRIRALVMFDPCVFPTWRWRTRLTLARLRKYGLVGGLVHARRLREAGQAFEDGAIRNFGRQVPPVSSFAADLRTLSDRGVAVRLVYSGSSLDRRDFDAQCRRLLVDHGLAGRVEAELLEDVDHVITPIAAQRRVLERFEAWLTAASPGG